MDISTTDIKSLRDETGVSIGKCKEALTEAGGDMDKAREILKEFSVKAAAKKSDRDLGAGNIITYVHGTGTMGVMLELLCETDFVAANDDFKTLGNDIALHIVAMNSEADSILSEPFVKNPEITIEGRIQEAVQKLGERIELGRFARYAIGE
jgi:elongation factor Ts